MVNQDTEMQTEVEVPASQAIMRIAKGISDDPSLQETDQHIGRLTRELHRFRDAFTKLLAYTHSAEAELAYIRQDLSNAIHEREALKETVEQQTTRIHHLVAELAGRDGEQRDQGDESPTTHSPGPN